MNSRSLLVWKGGVPPEPVSVTGELAWPSEGSLSIVPVHTHGDYVAAVFVPELPGRGAPRLNGRLLREGCHLVRAADHLRVRGEDRDEELWFSLETRVEAAPYDPEIHGGDLFCFRTKARLEVGENIVICPGVCGAGHCGTFYRARAWQADLACQNCGFLEHEKPWTPPVKKDGLRLAGLLAMISLEATRKRRG